MAKAEPSCGGVGVVRAAPRTKAREPVTPSSLMAITGSQAVLHDTALARSLVRKGGIIVWHDYHGQDTVDVRRVLETLHRHTEDSGMKARRGDVDRV